MRRFRLDSNLWRPRDPRYPNAYRGARADVRIGRIAIGASVTRERSRWLWGLDYYRRHVLHVHLGPVSLRILNVRVAGWF